MELIVAVLIVINVAMVCFAAWYWVRLQVLINALPTETELVNVIEAFIATKQQTVDEELTSLRRDVDAIKSAQSLRSAFK